MKTASLCILFVFFGCFLASGQDIQSGISAQNVTYFKLPAMQKVVVCADDHAVWGLAVNGEVYLKKSGEDDFKRFGNFTGVRDLAGYRVDKMYFLIGAELYEVSGPSATAKIGLPPGTGTINNIAVVNGSTNRFLAGYIPHQQDWLAVATSTQLFRIERSDPLRTLKISNELDPLDPAKDWRITNAGYKSIDFQFRAPEASSCFGNTEFKYFNRVGTAPRMRQLPESGAEYSGKVNCSYFESTYNEEVQEPATMMDFWGTDNGLFIKYAQSCNVRRVIQSKVNDIKQLNLFRDFFNYKVTLVATDEGLFMPALQYGMIYGTTPDITRISFYRFNIYNGAVNSIALDVYYSPDNPDGLCDQAVWLATADGIRRLGLSPARFSDVDVDLIKKAPDIFYVDGPVRQRIYQLCNGQQYTFKIQLPQVLTHTYKIEWLRAENMWEIESDRVVQENLTGLTTTVIDVRGDFGIRITSDCGESMDLGKIWLRQPQKIEPEFNYPEVITMYEGCSYTFRAKEGNIYRWELDGELIPGATSNVLTTTMPGKYRLLYQDCENNFTRSEVVELKLVPAIQPVIAMSKQESLCFGEQVTLTAPYQEGASYKWYPTGETTQSIVTAKPGNYHVDVILDGNCFRRSPTAVVKVQEEIKLERPPDFQLCTKKQQQLRLTAAPGFSSYTWNGVETTANYLDVTSAGSYTLQVTDARGCKASTLYLVMDYCPPPKPPNVFSPNSDGLNDMWVVEADASDETISVVVYNRYGAAVFQDSGHKIKWDGRHRGVDLPPGTYYYVLKKDGDKTLTGPVSLIR
ncbi:gliding motility-associated C-terminal domain-containing protein [Pedobacter sp. JY14-1]|uniref:gliding motility-associated C-terminal domain-containing protein n=1 Tax=Pedobacter sp. JY14-1 TaxID=3034151 RepID=UPI0023E1B3A4|nr:gliding motility-associated C-terminal domain-containing protein [Pedobacter sp. JY14-1]